VITFMILLRMRVSWARRMGECRLFIPICCRSWRSLWSKTRNWGKSSLKERSSLRCSQAPCPWPFAVSYMLNNAAFLKSICYRFISVDLCGLFNSVNRYTEGFSFRTTPSSTSSEYFSRTCFLRQLVVFVCGNSTITFEKFSLYHQPSPWISITMQINDKCYIYFVFIVISN